MRMPSGGTILTFGQSRGLLPKLRGSSGISIEFKTRDSFATASWNTSTST